MDYEYKIVFIGEAGIGAKTWLINRLAYNMVSFEIPSTPGAYCINIFVQVNLGIIGLQLWDTCGQEKYRGLNQIFIKGSHCIILGYDITHRRSFEEIKNFHYIMVKDIVGDDSLIYLVANKIDLYENKEVSEDEAKDYAKEKGIKYFKVSCLNNVGINELLEDIAYSLIKKFKRVLKNKDKYLIREITKNGTIINGLNSIRGIAKEEKEIEINDKDNYKIGISLNKYYNY